MKKLTHKALANKLRYNHDNIFNYYESPDCIDMIEDNNDIDAVIGWAEEIISQYQALITEIEKHK